MRETKEMLQAKQLAQANFEKAAKDLDSAERARSEAVAAEKKARAACDQAEATRYSAQCHEQDARGWFFAAALAMKQYV